MNHLKIIFLFFIVLIFQGSAFALDPVAPRADRAFGFLKIGTPQPSTDQCDLLRLNPASPTYHSNCQPNTMLSLPIGEYQVTVRMQEYSWTEKVRVYPTEYTTVAVFGYGNLIVASSRKGDVVQVLTPQGKEIAEYKANLVKTIPTGVYDVTIKSKGVSASMQNVRIITNATRELDVTYQ